MRFLQASDFHLDAPFGALSAPLGAKRREEQLGTVARLVEAAHREGADALLLPGDLFERQVTRPETVRRLGDLLADAAPLPVLIAPGNHDPLEEGSFWSVPFASNVTVFGPAWERVEVGGIAVWGKGFSRLSPADDPMDDLSFDGGPAVLLLHADFVGEGATSPYAPVRARDFDRPGLLHAALGHIHKPWSPLAKVHYAGSLEPLSFKEEGDHGALLVDVTPSGSAVQALSLARRTCITREVSVEATEPSQVARELTDITEGLDPERTLLRLRLTGARSAGAEAAVWERALSEVGFEGQLVDETFIPIAVEEDPLTLRGRFTTLMEERVQSATEDELPILRQALRDGLAALEGRKILDL